jgi:hypothetical protein
VYVGSEGEGIDLLTSSFCYFLQVIVLLNSCEKINIVSSHFVLSSFTRNKVYLFQNTN